MAYRQYTRCVSPGSHLGKVAAQVIIAAAVGALPLFATLILGGGLAPPLVIAAVVPIIAYCRWWLYDRLVCLDGGRDVCALGMVLSVEPPTGKSGLDRLDTDYSINLLLAPADIGDSQKTMVDDAQDYQSWLIKDQLSGVTFPINETPKFTGHEVWDAPTANTLIGIYGEVDDVSDIQEQFLEKLAAQLYLPGRTAAMHAEFEGAGVIDTLNACLAALALASVAAVLCAAGFLGFLACIVLSIIAAVITAAGMATGLGDVGNPDDVDGNLGELHVNDASYRGADILVVKGTWVYDSAHDGWNEIHPIKHCQKIGKTWQGSWLAADVTDSSVIDQWCGAIGKASDPLTVGEQGKPENHWTLHPVVDGCRPPAETPDPGPH
jgi:hypothetical protein